MKSIFLANKAEQVNYVYSDSCKRQLSELAKLNSDFIYKKDDVIDSTAGMILHKKTGDYVKKGEIIAVLYANN